MVLPRELLILIDKDEKKPLIFPEHIVVQHPLKPDDRQTIRLFTEVKKLDAGDYLLVGHEKARIIERKAGAREAILNNLTSDRARFIRAIDRLAASCAFPLLLMEGTPVELLTKGDWCDDPTGAMDSLMRLLDARRITLEIVPCGTIVQRRVAGEWAARRLINGAIAHACPPSC